VDCLDFLLSPLKNKLPKICNGSQQLTALVLLVNEFFEAHSESIFTIENQTVGPTLKYFVSVVWRQWLENSNFALLTQLIEINQEARSDEALIAGPVCPNVSEVERPEYK
jgi:hypothetical protein